jgi:hypothetical protein
LFVISVWVQPQIR